MPSVLIDRGTCKYYADRAEHLDKITSTVDRTSFIFQTLLTFQKDGWKVAVSPKVCRSLEKMIHEADTDGLIVLLKSLSKSWDGAITSKFCRHVLEKTWSRCQSEPFCNDLLVQDFAQNFFYHITSNLERYLNHSHAQYTLRYYLQLAAGVQVAKDPLTNTYDVENVTLCTPFDQNYSETLSNLSQRFLMTTELHDYARNELVSPFVQLLLIVIYFRTHSNFKSSLETVMANADLFFYSKNQTLPDGFVHPTLVYFTDVVIRLMPGKMFARFLASHVLNSGADEAPICLMPAHTVASYALRAIFKRIKRPNDVQELLTALCQSSETLGSSYGLGSALRTKQHALINDLAALCGKTEFSEVQKMFLHILFLAFGFPPSKSKRADVEDKLIWSILSMTPVTDLPPESAFNNEENSDKSNELSKPVCLPGCLLAQTLLKYTVAKPKRLTAGICAQPDDQLHTWAQHAMLSRVLEALFQSTSVSFKHKSRLISSFQPILTTLACDRYGSHVVEAIWSATDGGVEPLLLKEQMAEQLVSAHQRLRVHRYGHFLYYKLNLGMFVDNKPLWRRRILKLEKRVVDSKNPEQAPTKRRKSSAQDKAKQ